MDWKVVPACVSRLFWRCHHHHQQDFSSRLYHPIQKSFSQMSRVIKPEPKVFTSSSVAAATKTVNRVSPNFQVSRAHYSQSASQDAGLRKLRLYKRVFALALFSGTLVLAWVIKKQRGARLKLLLEDCTRLPIDESLFGAKMSAYRYGGHVFPGAMVMTGVFRDLPSFQFRKDDVVVASFPKTGTTWIQEIVYMLTHKFERTDEKCEVLENRFPYLEYPYPGLKTVAGKVGPRFIKTHLPIHLLPPSFSESDAKLIYICRNPRDTVVSYYYFMQLLTQCSYQGTFTEFVTMFLSDMTMYSPFFDHVLGYWNSRNRPTILFVSYEDLHRNPVRVIKEIAEFLEVEASSKDIEYVAACTSFPVMANNPSVNYEHLKDLGFAHKDKGSFFRKGEVGNWKTHLNQQQVEEFEAWERKHLHDTGLKFTYEESHLGDAS